MPDIFDELTEIQTPTSPQDLFDVLGAPPETATKPFFKRGFGAAPETEQEIDRVLTGLGREFAGSFLGLPGDIQATIKSLLGIEDMPQVFPTSETVKQKLFDPFQRAVGAALVPETPPKSEAEIIGREAAGLAGSFLSPIGPIPKAATLILGSTIPSMAKAAARQFGATPSVEAGVGLITMLGTGLATGKAVRPKEVMRGLFKKAESLIPEGATADVTSLQESFTGLEQQLRKGLITPSKTQPLSVIRQIGRKIKDGRLEVNELLAAKRDVNELIKDPETLKRGRTFLKAIARDVDGAIEKFGKTNPEFLKNFRDANKIFGELASTPALLRKLEQKTDLSKADPLTIGLILMKPKLWIEALGISKALKGFDVLLRQPKIRSLYFQAIRKAGTETSKGLQSTVNSLDKEIRKEKETNPDLFQSL